MRKIHSSTILGQCSVFCHRVNSLWLRFYPFKHFQVLKSDISALRINCISWTSVVYVIFLKYKNTF